MENFSYASDGEIPEEDKSAFTPFTPESDGGGGRHDSAPSDISSQGSNKALVPPVNLTRDNSSPADAVHIVKTNYQIGGAASPLSARHVINSPSVHKKPKFFIGRPDSPAGSFYSGFSTPNRFTPIEGNTPITQRKMNYLTPPTLTQRFLDELSGGRASPGRNRVVNNKGIFDGTNYHIPWSASQRCLCGGDKRCLQCRDEVLSTVSSINPPPTFTAMDNIQAYRPRQSSCTCSAVFVATLVLSIIVLILIAAFIIYIEMVLKRTQYIPAPM